MDESESSGIRGFQADFIIVDDLEYLVKIERKKENLFRPLKKPPEKKTTKKFYGTLFSGLKEKVVLKSDAGLSEAKKYLKEAMATRGSELPMRRGSRRISTINNPLNLEDK